jgi:hypothetical protein
VDYLTDEQRSYGDKEPLELGADLQFGPLAIMVYYFVLNAIVRDKRTPNIHILHLSGSYIKNLTICKTQNIKNCVPQNANSPEPCGLRLLA